jgi:predicted site-specific integrase-resolvase
MRYRGDYGIEYNPDPAQLIKPAEAGSMFGVDAITVSRWARRGDIPFTRLPNRRMMFSRDWIEEYLLRRGRNGDSTTQ